MKSIWSHLVPRDAGSRRPQSDSDADAITPRTFFIHIRSIQLPLEVDQQDTMYKAKIEETVQASFDPKETENRVEKAFLENWCQNNDFPRPAIKSIWLEFTIVGQSQPFRSVHQIVSNGPSVMFCSNRLSAEPDRPSPLEVHIREYPDDWSKRDVKALPNEKVASRSRTWPYKMESLRRWSRISGFQHVRKQSQDKSVIVLNEQEGDVATLRPLVDAIEGDERRDDEEELLNSLSAHRNDNDPIYSCRCGKDNPRKDNHLRHVEAFGKPHSRHSYLCKCSRPNEERQHRQASDEASRDGVPSKPTNLPIATTPDGDLPRNNSAEWLNAAPSSDPCMGRELENQTSMNSIIQAANDTELSEGLILNQDDFDSGTGIKGEAHTANEWQLTLTTLAGPDALRLEDGLLPVKFTAETQDVDDSSISDGALAAEESRLLVQSRRSFQQSVESSCIHSFLLDTDDSQPDHVTRRPNSLVSTPSITSAFHRAGGNLAQELEQSGESEIEVMRDCHHGCTAQEVPFSGTPSNEETGSLMEKPHGRNGATVKNGKVHGIAGPQCPADFPSAVNSPPQGCGDLVGPGTQYTNTAAATSSQEVLKSDSREQEPGGLNEMNAWVFCQSSERSSRQSLDSEDLSFPDDYWIYDEKVKNHYHVEVGDDGIENISWYPLEFD